MHSRRIRLVFPAAVGKSIPSASPIVLFGPAIPRGPTVLYLSLPDLSHPILSGGAIPSPSNASQSPQVANLSDDDLPLLVCLYPPFCFHIIPRGPILIYLLLSRLRQPPLTFNPPSYLSAPRPPTFLEVTLCDKFANTAKHPHRDSPLLQLVAIPSPPPFISTAHQVTSQLSRVVIADTQRS